MRNQHLIQQHNETLIPASVNAIQFPSNPRSANWSFSNNFQKANSRPPLYCSNCGGNWLPNQRDKCIAKRKFCNNCGLMTLFVKDCRKQKNTKPQNSKKRTVKTVDEEPHPEASVSFLRTTKLYESDYSSGDDNIVALIENDIAKIEPLNMPIKIGNISTTLLVDSGSACNYLNRLLATQVVKSSPHAVWIHDKVSPELRKFSKEPIHIKGKIQTPITSIGWTSNSTTFTVVADGLKSLTGRDLFDHLGLAVTQSSSVQGYQVNTISSLSEFNEHIAKNFTNLILRIGITKNHIAKSNFHEDFQPRHQKGRRMPINLQDKVNMELKILLDEKHNKTFYLP